MPPASAVKDGLYQLADWVKIGGSNAREELLELGAYATIIKAWSLICYTGVETAVSFE